MVKIGAVTATGVLISSVIGTGIFTTTGFMARDLGHPGLILALWVLGGALALSGAMSYGELGAALPRVGGDYVYMRRAYGPLAGFLSGWTAFTIGFSTPIALVALATGFYFLELVPEAFPFRSPRLLALALVWLLTAVHARGVRSSGRLQNALSVLKVGGIAGLIAAGFLVGNGSWSNFGEIHAVPEVGPGAVFVSLIFVLYAYSGWNTAAYIAGEIRDPERAVPRVLIGGTLLVIALYLALNSVYLWALPAADLARAPVEPVARKVALALVGPGAAWAVAALICLSIGGATSAMIWAGPRIYFAMAQDGIFPRAFSRLGDDGTPRASLWIQCAWISALLVASGTYEDLLVYSGVALSLFAALAVSCVITLRVREPTLPRPYRVPFYPWTPALFVAISGVTGAWATLERPHEALWAALTLLSGLPLYYYLRRRHKTGS